jgi:hypothetical protein
VAGQRGRVAAGWGELCQANIAGRVIGCRLSQETRVQSALDDVAGNIRQQAPRNLASIRLPTRTNAL